MVEFVNEYISLEKRKVQHRDGGHGKYRSFVLFDDMVVSEGGWCGRKWMTTKEIIAAEIRWVKHSYETGCLEPDARDKWIPHQCGGCRWFAAWDADYGICCNEQSPNDGRAVFEHGGCIKHSDFDSTSEK